MAGEVKKKLLKIGLCLVSITGLTELVLRSYGRFTRDVGWEARQDHWKDSSKKMFWELFNKTNNDIIAKSDINIVRIRPGKNAKLTREADFTIYIQSESGLKKRIWTRRHFIEIFTKNKKLKAKLSRVYPKPKL